MKITKYVHSCLLIETPDRVGIIDPGEFSWESGLFNIDALKRLDDIVITHEHFDHMHVPFIQALRARFPEVSITTTAPAAAQLQQIGITANTAPTTDKVVLFAAAHETMEPIAPPPCANTGVHYLDQLTHPGDCHHFSETKEILALPLTGPWGIVARAAELILELQPKYVLPIHDWHWNEQARKQFYGIFKDFCKKHDVVFLPLEDGVPVEI